MAYLIFRQWAFGRKLVASLLMILKTANHQTRIASNQKKPKEDIQNRQFQYSISYIPYVKRLEFEKQQTGADPETGKPTYEMIPHWPKYYYGGEVFRILSSPTNTNHHIKFGVEEKIEVIEKKDNNENN